jgi:hypothetical protein
MRHRYCGDAIFSGGGNCRKTEKNDDARDGHTIIELSGKRLVDHASMVGIVASLKGKQIENVFVVL